MMSALPTIVSCSKATGTKKSQCRGRTQVNPEIRLGVGLAQGKTATTIGLTFQSRRFARLLEFIFECQWLRQ
jgi:hypothetical protein